MCSCCFAVNLHLLLLQVLLQVLLQALWVLLKVLQVLLKVLLQALWVLHAGKWTGYSKLNLIWIFVFMLSCSKLTLFFFYRFFGFS